MEIEDLFDEHGALSFEKQLRLADAVGESSWQFDMDAGTLTFDPFSVPIQVLGTVSESSKTWLWAWANQASNIPKSLLASCERLRSYGEDNAIAELTEPQLYVEPFERGHILAMVSVGILSAAAYYRGPYEGGAVFFAIPHLPPTVKDSRPLNLQVVSTFTRFISAHDSHHATAFESYVRQKGYSCHFSGARRLTAHIVGEPPLEAWFDSEGRLVRLDGQISSPKRDVQQTAKLWWRFW